MRNAAAIRERIRREPVWFCEQFLGLRLWSKQREILEAVRDEPRVAVRSCHGAGKTTAAAASMLWFLAAHRGSRVISTAPTQAQVKDVMWREARTLARHARGLFGDGIFDTRIELADDWFAAGLVTDAPERFQGHHAEHLLLVVDEASGVHEEIFAAMSGALTGPGARMLMIGNPTRTSGEFYVAFHSSRRFYRQIAISALDTPAFTGEKVPRSVARRLTSKRWVEECRAKWGEQSPLFQVRVLGEFPSQSDDAVCSLAAIEAAQARELEPAMPLVVACDVARFGSDETVIAVRRGDVVRIAKTYTSRDTMQTAGEILSVARKWARASDARPTIVVDDAGLGGGVVDRLREVHRDGGGFPVVAFNGAHSARDPREYPNRRSEAWFDFSEQLGEIDLDGDEMLAADLAAPRYTLDSAGRRVVESKDATKKRLGRSPDRADAVLMAFAVKRAPAPLLLRSEPSDEQRMIATLERLDGVFDRPSPRARRWYDDREPSRSIADRTF